MKISPQINDEFNGWIADHKNLLEQIKENQKWLKQWQQYKKKLKSNEDFYIFDNELFTQIENDYHIVFPNNIKYFYTEIGSDKDDTNIQLRYIEQKKGQYYFHYFFTESFVKKIIDEYQTLTIQEQEILHVELLDSYEQRLKDYSSDLEFMLCCLMDYYDEKNNHFRISLIQNIYVKNNFDSNLLYKVLLTWCHCGGCGMLFLNSEKQQYISCFSYGYLTTFEYQNKSYEYCGLHYQIDSHFFSDSVDKAIFSDIKKMVEIIKTENLKDYIFTKKLNESNEQVDIIIENSKQRESIFEIQNTDFEIQNTEQLEGLSLKDFFKYVFLIIIFFVIISRFKIF